MGQGGPGPRGTIGWERRSFFQNEFLHFWYSIRSPHKDIIITVLSRGGAGVRPVIFISFSVRDIESKENNPGEY